MDVNSNNTLALSLRNGEEKYYLADQQLKYVLNEVPLNIDQKELILRLKNTLPHDAYTNFKSRQAYVGKLTKWEGEINSKLGKGFVSTYLTKIVNIDGTSDESSRAEGVGGDCVCSRSSDWCAHKGPDKYSCAWVSPSHLCTESSVGCGTLLLYSCDGMCYRVLAEA